MRLAVPEDEMLKVQVAVELDTEKDENKGRPVLPGTSA